MTDEMERAVPVPLAELCGYGVHPLALPAAIRGDHHPAKVYLADKSTSGRRMLKHYLTEAARLLTGGLCDAETFDWSQLRFAHVAAVRQQLTEQGKAANTINLAVTALRGVAKTAWRLELIDSETYRRIEDVKGVRAERLPTQRRLTRGELKSLFANCDDSIPGRRDAAALAMLYGGGLRRSELVNLDLADLRPLEEGGYAVYVHRGKGDKDRAVYATDGAAEMLEGWLEKRGDQPGPLFPALTPGGNVTDRRMSPNSIVEMLRRMAERAGVKPFGPHDVRATFASDMLEEGADLLAVSSLMGHASVDTTRIYDRRGEKAKQKATRLLKVPAPARA